MNETQLIRLAVARMQSLTARPLKLMEVCGTHTEAIARSGLRYIVPENIQLLSGPGCPVCVTASSFIDSVIALLNSHPDITVATFGDLVRVKGSTDSLLTQRSRGSQVVVVYSPLDALQIARANRSRQVVFLAVGFETTAPTIAACIKAAKAERLTNISFYTALKRIGPILRVVLQASNLDGLICPGHVAAITGSSYFTFVAKEYGIPAVVCGFEALDLITAVVCLCQQAAAGQAQLVNLYRRSVTARGNIRAQQLIDEVFTASSAEWRGLGVVSQSALVLKPEYCQWDAAVRYGLLQSCTDESENSCQCADILLGRRTPLQCPLFARTCFPDSPVGPCMVSSEGACAIYYRYHRGRR